jgi:hypothetical protein
MVPDACTDVIVNSGLPNMPLITGLTNICQRLTVNNGASVTVADGAVLTVLK